MNNMNYINQINDLKNQLDKEKRKNQTLINENNNLKIIINNLKNENNLLNQFKEKNKLLQEEIQKFKASNNNQNNSQEYLIPSLKPGEKIMTINFVSMENQDIGHFNLICKNSDLFIRLEERLYNKFPQFKDFETYFEVNTRRIKRFKTIEENKIKGNDLVTIGIIENDE